MIYEIGHQLQYQYSNPVFLETQLLHLMARSDSTQKLKSFSLEIFPKPALISNITDALGNPAYEIWFRNNTQSLSIKASSVVEVLRQNPFDYILRENSLCLPIRYPDLLLPLLHPYCRREEINESVEAFAAEAAKRAGYKTAHFLSELCLMIHQRIHYIRREEGCPWSSDKTLSAGKGSCRDMTVLFMDCCRAQGFASRFTSGYVEDITNLVGNDLHAWAEVYMEGAGWRGYDPAIGLAVGEHYVAIASSPDPRLVNPVIGTFRSNSAISHLQSQVNIHSVGETISLTA
jgi:transglutaminase-like putative cysteine protease